MTRLLLPCLILGVLSISAQSFTDQTHLLNRTAFYSPCVVDMNGDGLDDVVTFAYDNGQYDMFIDYQQSNGTFSLVAFDTDFQDAPTWSIAAGDLDGNGYNDLIIGNGNSVSFIKANADGTAYSEQYISDYIFSQRTNIVDIDNDGDLDAFACHDVDLSHPYRNDGFGNMVEDQTLIQTVPLAGNYASIWTDFDNDGDTDMYLSKCRGGSSPGDPERENALYVNNGNGSFVLDAANVYGLFDNEQSWVTVFEDFDNDGDFDTYTVNHTTSNYLRKNDGSGHYTEITAGSGIDANDLDSWACIGADFDNDGHIDILTESQANKQFYRNLGDNDSIKFQAMPMPFDRGALCDLNNDGFIDVFTGSRLWMNDGNSNSWFKVALTGTNSNINGIGARLEVYGDWGVKIRENRSGESFKPASSMDVFFGLGSSTSIDSLVVKWPSGQVDVVHNPAINSELALVETEFMANLRLTSVDPSLKQVSIKNFGTASQDISAYRLCSNLNYTHSGIAAQTSIISGDLDLSPGEEVTVQWNIAAGFRPIGDDMGLYLPTGSFGAAESMVDFMQYLTIDGDRENVAVAKGIWTIDETVMGDPAYTYIGNGSENGASFWMGVNPACDPGNAPVDLTKSFDPVNGVQDRLQVKWYKASPQIRYTDEDAMACDIKFWKKRDLDPVTGNPVGPAYVAPDTTLIENAKKFLPDGVSPKSIFKWPVKFRADGANNNKRVDPNIRYEWKVRCACDHGAGAETPWSATKIFNTPDFDPVTGIYGPKGLMKTGLDQRELDFSIFPNPSEGRITVSMSQAQQDLEFVLRDLQGRILKHDQVQLGKGQVEFRLDFSDLPRGMYQLELRDGQIQKSQAIVMY